LLDIPNIKGNKIALLTARAYVHYVLT